MIRKRRRTRHSSTRRRYSSTSSRPRRRSRRSPIKAFFKFLLLILLLLGAFYVWLAARKQPPDKIIWGLTFSTPYARDLKLDPRETYLAILDELKPQSLRLVAYWTEIERTEGDFDFTDLDFQVAEAERRGIPYVITTGHRVPRYPECFTPKWAKSLETPKRQEKILDLVRRTMTRYDQKPKLAGWQLENEPYLGSFGICPPLDEAFLEREVELARSLTDKEIIMTDTGEGSFWLKVSRHPDVIGTTLYRRVLNPKNEVFTHFLPPSSYTARASLVKLLNPNIKRAVVSELQAEPWGAPLHDKPQEFTDRTLSLEHFKDNIRFAAATGLDEIYLWGAEWWYMKHRQGDSSFWEEAKRVYSGSL